MIHIDCFSGSVAELKPKQRGDIMIVLEVLSRDPNVSTWDMDDGKRFPLWKTIERLQEEGFIVSVERSYPWLRFEVNEAGKKALAEWKKGKR